MNFFIVQQTAYDIQERLVGSKKFIWVQAKYDRQDVQEYRRMGEVNNIHTYVRTYVRTYIHAYADTRSLIYICELADEPI